jgi:hypothetical protein
MKDCNVYFKESSQGWQLDVRLGPNPHNPYGPEWTYIATFSDRKTAIEHFKDNYLTR